MLGPLWEGSRSGDCSWAWRSAKGRLAPLSEPEMSSSQSARIGSRVLQEILNVFKNVI